MNRLTKKIRKSNRRYNQYPKQNQLQLDDIPAIIITNDQQLETLSSSLANMLINIEESRFYEIVTGDVIKQLIDCLKHTNPQLVINSLNAFQNLFRVTSFFGASRNIFEEMSINLGLLLIIEKLQNDTTQALQLIERDSSVQHVCSALFNFLTELFESCSQGLLSQLENQQFFNCTLGLVVQVIQNPVTEDVFLGLLNYLQVLSESVPKVNSIIATSSQLFGRMFQLFEGDFSSSTQLQQSTFTYKLKTCSMMLPVVLNILTSSKNKGDIIKFTNTVGQLITNGLSVRIFTEIQNLKQMIVQILNNEEKKPQIQGEGQLEQEENLNLEQTYNLDQDKRVKNTSNIWLNTADAIIEQLRFVGRLYEGTDYEDEAEMEDEEQTSNNNQKDPQVDQVLLELLPLFYQQNFQNEILAIIYNNFYCLSVLVHEEEFLTRIQGYQIGIYIKEALLMIVQSSLAVLQNIIHLLNPQFQYPILDQYVTGILGQLNSLLNFPSILYSDREDFQDILTAYLKCLQLIISRGGQKTVILIPENALIKLTELLFDHKGANQESHLHLIELLKLRYNSKIQNSTEVIQSVTNALIPALKQPDPLIAAQALDTLFDIFTEEDHNIVLAQMNLLQQLQIGHDYMKKELQSFKKQMRLEDFNFVKLTLTNLRNFIQYKKKMMKC